MDEFIRRKNVELFRGKLERECSPDLRAMLERLLREHEAPPVGADRAPPAAA